jgi:hypothetical protein
VTKPQDQWPALDEAALLEQLPLLYAGSSTLFRRLSRLPWTAQGGTEMVGSVVSRRNMGSNLFLFLRHSWIKLTSDLNAVLRASKASQTINAT